MAGGSRVKPRVIVVALMLATIAWIAWRSQLWTVSRPGTAPAPLRLLEPAARTAVRLDATLPAVPFGSERLESGRGVLLIHYWAPWEHASREQVAGLDSLRELPELEGMRVAVVCFDPFPSVARFVARQGWRISVLIDTRGRLRQGLPCPSVPYTYVLDADGRVAVAQAGEVDWWAPETRAVLAGLMSRRRTGPGSAGAVEGRRYLRAAPVISTPAYSSRPSSPRASSSNNPASPAQPVASAGRRHTSSATRCASTSRASGTTTGQPPCWIMARTTWNQS